MSKLLNSLLDQGVEEARRMLRETGAVQTSILTVSGIALVRPTGSATRRTPRDAEEGDTSGIARGFVAPAWLPGGSCGEGVHVSATDMAGHRLGRTYRVSRAEGGMPDLVLVPELSGLTRLGDLATTMPDEVPSRLH